MRKAEGVPLILEAINPCRPQRGSRLAYPALAHNHARLPASPALPTLNKYFPKKVL